MNTRHQPQDQGLLRNRPAVWLAAIVGVAVRTQAAPPASEPQSQPAQINPSGLTSSAVCGQCHQAIHAVWQRSLHSQSWTDGVFQASYRRSVEAFGAERSRLCMSCHAPTVRVTKDYAAKEAITAEGITCDFCHSVQSVDVSDRQNPMRLDAGMTKYGPMRQAKSPVHQTKTSPLHTQAEFCGGCHEYRNPEGMLILGTFSEWKSSKYALQGKHCQQCHMPLVEGRVVALNVKEQSGKSVNLHDVSGSHNLEQVRKAVTLKFRNVERNENDVWLNLEVANVGSGHCFPTGLPTHRAILTATLARQGSEIERQDLPFEIVFLDKNGQTLRREYDVFQKSASMLSDTRLRPGESRPVTLHFSRAGTLPVDLNVSLSYEYATETLVSERGGDRFEPVTMRFLVGSFSEKVQ